MSTYRLSVEFYVKAESSEEAESILDNGIVPELAQSYEVSDVWECSW